jgi:phospholipid-binding lipoprotein MlaA
MRLKLLYLPGLPKKLAALAVVSLLTACTAAPTPVGFADPFEQQNRKTHEVNRAIDRAVLRPVATAYGRTAPSPARKAIGNFSENLGLPSTVLNNLLQFRIEEAGANTFRFLINTTFGFAGLMDVASEAGIARDSSDFGETLYVWGVGEGSYIELPLLGPSTARAAAGRVVDVITNPLNFVLEGGDRTGATTAGVLARVDDRYEFRDLVDSILYDSEDSYAQARLLYLQNRRFSLSGETQLDEFDPYEDVYGTQ